MYQSDIYPVQSRRVAEGSEGGLKDIFIAGFAGPAGGHDGGGR